MIALGLIQSRMCSEYSYNSIVTYVSRRSTKCITFTFCTIMSAASPLLSKALQIRRCRHTPCDHKHIDRVSSMGIWSKKLL
ncbi:hypothetical protein Plhal304r1_c059g0147281 [Plasmopara halstedii]